MQLCGVVSCYAKCSSHLCCVSSESYLDDYSMFVFCPEGTEKMQQNAVSKASQAKAFVRYMMAGEDSTKYWTLLGVPVQPQAPEGVSVGL